MNNTFSFSRFGKVFVHDFNVARSQFTTTVMILVLVTLAPWLLSMAFHIGRPDAYVMAETRYNLISVAVSLAAFMAASRIYKNVNLVGKGNYFALLPASLGEKFLSMILYCFILAPVLVWGASVLLDILFTLLPFGPYKSYIWEAPSWSDNLAGLPIVYQEEGGDWTSGRAMVSQSFFTSFQSFVLTTMLSGLQISIFFFTNTLFKKHKVTKTVLWFILLSLVVMMISVPIINSNIEWFANLLDRWFADASGHQIVQWFFWVSTIGMAVCIFLLLFFTYRRLKKMQY